MQEINQTITLRDYQHYVFGEPIQDAVPSLRKYSKKVDELLINIIDNFPETSVDNLQEALLQLEKVVSQRLFTPENSLTTLNDFVKRIDGIEPTPFLSDSAIEHILLEHPPTTLNSYLSYLPSLINLSPRAQLSLTRFTEDRDWQHIYQLRLTETNLKDYQHRLPECIGVEACDYRVLASMSSRTLKPWGVSHCKETGVIILFENHAPVIATPQLLKLSVFLHYVFEVHNFSLFLKQNEHLKIGQLAKNIIRSKEPLLPFLTDGNAHDETLYWQQALNELQRYVRLTEYFSPTGVSLVNDKLTSTNFVDVLWNINNIGSSNSHKYHLQQEVWLSLLRVISERSYSEFEKLIKDSLMLDNSSFLRQALN